MDLKELFAKIYNSEITEKDVIVKYHRYDTEDICYILNKWGKYWYDNDDEYISLSFFEKDDDYIYEIMNIDNYYKDKEYRQKQLKIQRLENELKKLKGE